METKSQLCLPSVVGNAAQIARGPLSLEQAVAAVEDDRYGAVVTFSGNIRGSEGGEPIEAIRYEAYESLALKELQALIDYAAEKWDVRARIAHRIGEVPSGESSLLIVCGGKHRPEAFEACRYILEEIKAHVPFWKVEFKKRGQWSKASLACC